VKGDAMWSKRLQAVKYINPYQFFGWFAGLSLPWALLNSAFIGWHNSVVPSVEVKHLILRAIIGATGFGAIIAFVAWKTVWPAIKRAEIECGQQKNRERLAPS
jgi:hypothetical protein